MNTSLTNAPFYFNARFVGNVHKSFKEFSGLIRGKPGSHPPITVADLEAINMVGTYNPALPAIEGGQSVWFVNGPGGLMPPDKFVLYEGTVTSIADQGATVRLEDGTDIATSSANLHLKGEHEDTYRYFKYESIARG